MKRIPSVEMVNKMFFTLLGIPGIFEIIKNRIATNKILILNIIKSSLPIILCLT